MKPRVQILEQLLGSIILMMIMRVLWPITTVAFDDSFCNWRVVESSRWFGSLEWAERDREGWNGLEAFECGHSPIDRLLVLVGP